MKKKLQKIKNALVKNKIKDFEIYVVHTRGGSIQIEQGGVNSYEKNGVLCFALRLFHSGRMGFSYGNDFSASALQAMIDKTLSLAMINSADRHHVLVPPCSAYPEINNWDESLLPRSFQEKLAQLQLLEQTILHHHPAIKKTHDVNYDETLEEIYLENSLGLSCRHDRTRVSLTAMALAERAGQSEASFVTESASHFSGLDPVELGERVACKAVSLLGGLRVPNYHGPIIVTAEVGAEMLAVLSGSLLIENIHKKNSYLTGRLGQKIYAGCVTLIDDGLIGNPAIPFDGVGSPRQKTVVLEKGILQKFLYDATWAERDGVDSTGNSCRQSVQAPPALASNFFYLEPGRLSLEDLIQTMQNGLVVADVIGMHTADAISGEFSVGVQGWQIKAGERVGSFRAMAFSGSLHEIFANIEAVGSELRFFDDIACPAFLINQAEVSGE